MNGKLIFVIEYIVSIVFHIHFIPLGFPLFCFIHMTTYYDYMSSVQDGETLLHRAAFGDSIDLVDWLVKEHGLDIQQCSEVWGCSKNSAKVAYIFFRTS